MSPKFSILGAAVVAVLAVTVLAAPAGAATKKKTIKNGTPVAIPDEVNDIDGIAVQTLKIKKSGTIKEIKVGVQIAHTDTCDLTVWLGKGDKFIPLANHSCSLPNNDNFGGGTGCSGPLTLFDSAANLAIYDGANPFAGSFRPNQNALQLGIYDGDRLKGPWRLVVTDDTDTDTGTINCFEIQAKYRT